MKIGYFISHFPYKNRLNDTNYFKQYHHGGAEIAAYCLAVNIAQGGHEIDVFTTSINSNDSFEKKGDLNIHRYGTSFKIEQGNLSFKLFQKPLDLELDIVHAHFSTPPAELAALKYAKRKRVPFILTYHGDGQGGFGGVVRRITMSFYNKYLLDKVLFSSNVIISPSEYYINESQFLEKYRDKIVVIPNGINIEDFDLPYSKEECREKLDLPIDSRIILFVGTLSPHKGPDVLLKAMPKIIKNIPNTKLVFVGSGRMKEELEALSRRLGLGKYVKFAGFVEESLKTFYYNSADVFCLPSVMKHEIFGIVNLEAMACSVPIVASKIGGVPDVVKNGENGVLVPPKDEEALAEAIIYLLENEEVRRRMGRNGRKKVEDYSWERIAEETEKVYEGLI